MLDLTDGCGCAEGLEDGQPADWVDIALDKWLNV